MMIPVGNKLIVEIINSDEDDWNPLYKILTKAKVLDLGNEVLKYIKKDDIITISKSDIHILKENIGFCVDRNIIFINDYPHEDKVHINPCKKEIDIFDKGNVIKSSCSDIKSDEIIGYIKGKGGLILPDYTEVISKSQIYFKY